MAFPSLFFFFSFSHIYSLKRKGGSNSYFLSFINVILCILNICCNDLFGAWNSFEVPFNTGWYMLVLIRVSVLSLFTSSILTAESSGEK